MNSVGRKRGRGGQRGSSLIELAVVMVVVGGLAITAAVLSRNATRATAASADRDLREIAERAVIGYAHANYRLPCPSANQGGLEDCATGQVGLFPWRTVGVPHLAAGMLRYGVYRNPSAASPWLDMDLAVSLHRLRPLFVEGAPPVLPNIALRAGTAPVSLVDFCLAVTRASNTTPVTAEVLAVSTPDAGVAGTTVRRPVAFVIAASGPSDADGDGNVFDGLNATASSAAPTFESANRAQSRTYDDQITAVSFNTLFGQLDCGEGVSTVSHAHVNAATAGALMQQALIDYKVQLQIQAKLAAANVASGTAGVFSAGAGLSGAVASVAVALALSATSKGGLSPLVAPPAVASLVANTLALASAAGALAFLQTVKSEFDGRVTGVELLVTQSAARAVLIDANARTADLLGF